MNLVWSSVLSAMIATLSTAGCAPSEPNPLDELGTVRLTIKGQAFELWVADTTEEHAKGLMFITKDQMAPLPDGTERGMIFIFPYALRAGFWMKNTIIPLDIAYVTSDLKVLKMYTMAAMDVRVDQYLPGAPYRIAIEINANRLAELGVKEGDTLDIPASVLKRRP